MSQAQSSAYAAAGVDIALADNLLSGLKPTLKAASRPEVLGSVGGFGGLFDLSRSGLKEPVLVASTDGVGTKLRVAFMTGDHRGIGHDIVNHCVNDIAVLGAEPLFFLDYIGCAGLGDGVAYSQVVKGIAKACKSAGAALLGGETAEMPGFYAEGEYDLVGTIVGVIDKRKLLTGKGIRPGDKLIGLPSNGLHTNGYSLARKLFLDVLGLSPSDPLPGGRTTVGAALLKPHTEYGSALRTVMVALNGGRTNSQRKGNAILGAAHITGGGFDGNVPRILPEGCGGVVDASTWKPLPVFRAMAETGEVPQDELYTVFNMGMGMVVVAQQGSEDEVVAGFTSASHKARVIGEVTAGEGVAVQLS